METSDALSTNGELETRRVKEINDNDLDAAPVKLPKRRRPKFGDHHDLESMKSNIHDKGTQLSTVWNELYNLLGDYQAKLFSREGEFLASKAKYDAVTDMDQLRNDLISKDNEVKELKERLSVMESRSETIQLDLSVKNSLLKKYQQDLLDKEAALLNLQSANKKLENRVQALEMKLAGSVAISTQSPQPGTSGARQASTPPQLKRRGALPPQHSTPKRRPLLPAIAPKPATNLEPETREEDSSQKLSPPSDARDNNVENRENENSVNIPLYAEQWIKSETPTTMDEDENSNQNVFPGNENEVEEMAQWQGQDSGLDGEGSLMIDSPSNKINFGQNWRPAADRRFECRYCSRKFSQAGNRHRHEQTVHEKILPFRCDICDKYFGQKVNLRIHMARHHARMQAAADARALLQNSNESGGNAGSPFLLLSPGGNDHPGLASGGGLSLSQQHLLLSPGSKPDTGRLVNYTATTTEANNGHHDTAATAVNVKATAEAVNAKAAAEAIENFLSPTFTPEKAEPVFSSPGKQANGGLPRLVDRLMCQLCYQSLSDHAQECPLRI